MAVDGSALPYAVDFRGKPACPCLAEWLPFYEKELLRRGIIKHNVDIFQLIGGAAASAGTHSKGGAYDVAQVSDQAILVAREMGAAAWHRLPNWDGKGGMEHQHGVLNGCPHNGPAAYQINAYKAGFNGLGLNGAGGKDTGPRVLPLRTWVQGIEWAKGQGAKNEKLSVALANIKSNPIMPIEWVRSDMHLLSDFAAEATFGSEIAPKDYKTAWGNIVGSSFGLERECPIHLGNGWMVTSHTVVWRTIGVPGITPNRYDTIVEAQRPGGFPVAFIAMHTVSQKDDPKAAKRGLRRFIWNHHIEKTQATIQDLNRRGFTVVVGGDLNDAPGPTRFTPNQVNLLNEGLVQLTVCPAAGVTGHLDAIFREHGHTDHPILKVAFTIQEKV